ncbi:MAG: hypothetical protein QF805_23470, partial [Pirellulaceae bacterium]|nr:hypothetical protein [Pirellulaceae bacterium]
AMRTTLAELGIWNATITAVLSSGDVVKVITKITSTYPVRGESTGQPQPTKSGLAAKSTGHADEDQRMHDVLQAAISEHLGDGILNFGELTFEVVEGKVTTITPAPVFRVPGEILNLGWVMYMQPEAAVSASATNS